MILFTPDGTEIRILGSGDSPWHVEGDRERGYALVDDRDGSVKFYDINALSNFVADPVTVLGFDPHDALIDCLVDRITAGKAA